METRLSQNLKVEVNKSLREIVNLYENLSISVLFDDLVAIGTVPVPDIPKPTLVVKSTGSVKIDTVPLPERRKKLKRIVSNLLNDCGEITLKKLF